MFGCPPTPHFLPDSPARKPRVPPGQSDRPKVKGAVLLSIVQQAQAESFTSSRKSSQAGPDEICVDLPDLELPPAEVNMAEEEEPASCSTAPAQTEDAEKESS